MADVNAPVQEAPAIWVYALTERGGATLPSLPGVAGARLRLIDAGNLSAAVSNVPLDEFGEEALRRNLENLAWLEAVALAHHGVIDAMARLCPLLPMRLATVYSTEETMVVALAAHAGQFRSALDRLRSRIEWGVKAYVAPAPLEAPADAVASGSTAPAARTAARRQAEEKGAGMAYLRRRRDAWTSKRDATREAVDSARAVHAELGGKSSDSRLHPPQSAQLSGRSEPMVLNAAYLVDNDQAASFAAMVEALGNRYPRLRLELTGPWPPYSFAAEQPRQEGA